MESVREESVRVLVAEGDACVVEVAITEAFPVHPVVVVEKMSLVVVALLSLRESAR